MRALPSSGETATGAGEIVGRVVGDPGLGAVVEEQTAERVQKGAHRRASVEDMGKGLEQNAFEELGRCALLETLVEGLSGDAPRQGEVLQRGVAAFEIAEGQSLRKVAAGGPALVLPLDERGDPGQFVRRRGHQSLEDGGPGSLR